MELAESRYRYILEEWKHHYREHWHYIGNFRGAYFSPIWCISERGR